MDDYLEWLTSGLIFLWILGAHDARAAPVDVGDVRYEISSQRISPAAGQACSSKGRIMRQMISHFAEVITQRRNMQAAYHGTEKGAR